MDQTETPMPVMTPPAQPPQLPPQRNVGYRGLFLLAGMAIGATIVLATMFIFIRPKEEVVYRQKPAAPAKSEQPGPKAADPSNGAASGAQKTTGKPPSAMPHPANGSAGPKPDTKVPPYNPFEGAIASAMPEKEIGGTIKSGSEPQLPDIGNSAGTPSQVTADEPPKSRLITIRLAVDDPTAAVKALQGLASGQGGSAIQFDETAISPDPEGALLFIPTAKEVDAEKLLAQVGNVVATDDWAGTTGDRIDRIEQTAKDRVSDLHIHRQELLVKYYEDAPEIKHIDEDSNRINRCLAALQAQRPGPKTTVLKIKFLS